MYSLGIAYLIMLEQRIDRLRAAEEAQYLKTVWDNPGSSNNRFKLVIAWLGRQLKALGTKLEQFDETPSIQCCTLEEM